MPNCIPQFCYHQFSGLPPTTEANLKTYSRQKNYIIRDPNNTVRGSNPASNRLFSSPKRLDRLWGPSSLLINGYRGALSWEQSCRGFMLTTHLHLLPRLWMSGVIPTRLLYTCIAWTGETLRFRRAEASTKHHLLLIDKVFGSYMCYVMSWYGVDSAGSK
jgi:hypothetical protein